MQQSFLIRHAVGLAAAALVSATAAATVSGQAPAKTVNDGVYSEAQAERGRKVFEAQCTTCHDAARFTGKDFVTHWSGKPLHALFDLMRTTMPEDNPSSLQAQQYADIVSFFLSMNKYPVGSDELKGTDEAMRAVQMEAPKKSNDQRSVR